MRQRITLQGPVWTPDGAGGRVRSFADLPNGTVWAEVTPRFGGEMLDSGRVNAEVKATFRVYTRNDVNETCRILWQGEAWNIVARHRLGDSALRMDLDAVRGRAP